MFALLPLVECEISTAAHHPDGSHKSKDSCMLASGRVFPILKAPQKFRFIQFIWPGCFDKSTIAPSVIT